jgi:hypothetical protein
LNLKTINMAQKSTPRIPITNSDAISNSIYRDVFDHGMDTEEAAKQYLTEVKLFPEKSAPHQETWDKHKLNWFCNIKEQSIFCKGIRPEVYSRWEGQEFLDKPEYPYAPKPVSL